MKVELLALSRKIRQVRKANELGAIADELQALAAQPAKDGWVMMPVEPTSAMVAAMHCVDTCHGSWPREAYRAARLAAAQQEKGNG